MWFEIVGAIFVGIGVLFSILGVVGVLRLPDTYTRLHASGKTSTLGILFICLGTGFLLPQSVPKLIGLSLFIIFSAPVGSHAIAAAVHRGTRAHNEEAMEEGHLDELRVSGIHKRLDIQQALKEYDAKSAEAENNNYETPTPEAT